MAIEGIEQIGQSMPMIGMGQKPPPDPDEMSDHIISDLDTNGDGVISVSELLAAGQFGEEIAKADTDGDGLVSQDELIAQIMEKMEEKGVPPVLQDGQMPDISEIKSMLTQLGTTNSTDDESSEVSQKGYDMISDVLKQLGVSEEETENILNMLQNHQLNLLG